LTAALFSTVVLYADRITWHRSGLVARYHEGETWSGSPVLTAIDPTISTPSLRRRSARLGLDTSSVTWSGYLHVPRGCAYTIEATADDGARVDIDQRVILDGAIERGVLVSRAEVWLTEGPHVIWVWYYNSGGDSHMQLRWACGGEPLRSVRAEHLWNYPPTAFQVRYARPLRLTAAGIVAAWTVALFALLIVKTLSGVRRSLGRLQREGRIDRRVALPLAVGGVLFVTGITWGLPDWGTWGADELIAADVFEAIEYWFGPGWSSRYPPLHYYVLAIPTAPVLAADWLGLLDSRALWSVSGILLAGRAISVLMSVGGLFVVYLAAERLFGRTAGVAAALAVAATSTFVYHAKTVNLDAPYVSWFLLSYYFYVRLWSAPRPAHSYLFALTATAAVCTKDQAYALYILSSLAVAGRFLWLSKLEGRSWGRALGRTTAVMTASGILALLAFAAIHNWAFNWAGFLDHLRIVRELGGAYGGVFPQTVSGQIAMLRAAVGQVGLTLGWPLFAFCLAGVAVELSGRRAARALWLLAPGISYYVFFIGIVGYHYDRFFMPVIGILAVFAGGLAARLVDRSHAAAVGQSARWRLALVAACFGYTIVQAASLDALMLTDVRYAAEGWMRAHVAPGQTVGYGGILEYLPRLQTGRVVRVARPDQLEAARPDFFVANPEFYLRHASGTNEARLYSALQDQARYVRVFRAKTRHWWNPLMRLKLFSDEVQDPFTNLDKINPTIEIYRRRDAARRDPRTPDS